MNGDRWFLAAMATFFTFIVIVFGGLLALAGFSIWNAHQRDTITDCTIEHKEPVPRGKSGNQYRVYTDQCGVLAVQDSLWAGRWDSADVYQSVEVGQRYDVLVQGGRYPFFSMFPNVLSFDQSR